MVITSGGEDEPLNVGSIGSFTGDNLLPSGSNAAAAQLSRVRLNATDVLRLNRTNESGQTFEWNTEIASGGTLDGLYLHISATSLVSIALADRSGVSTSVIVFALSAAQRAAVEAPTGDRLDIVIATDTLAPVPVPVPTVVRPAAPVIVADDDDRLDLLAARAYPGEDLNEAMRTLLWANRAVLGSNLVVSAGTILQAPTIRAVVYATGYRPLVGTLPLTALLRVDA